MLSRNLIGEVEAVVVSVNRAGAANEEHVGGIVNAVVPNLFDFAYVVS